MRFTSFNPNFAADVPRAMMAVPIARFIGIDIVRVAPGEADLQLAFREELAHRGVFLGGVVGAVADFAAGCAAATLHPPGATHATADYTVKLLAPARGEKLLAQGRILQPGRTMSVARTDVYILQAHAQTLCATALVTLRNFTARGSEHE